MPRRLPRRRQRGPPRACPIRTLPAILLDLVGSPMSPRIVTLSHATLTNTLLGVRDALGITAQQRCLAAGALSAEPTVLEWLLPWSAGAASVIVKNETLRDLDALQREIASAGVNFLHLPTEIWSALMARGFKPGNDLVGLVYGERPIARTWRATRERRRSHVPRLGILPRPASGPRCRASNAPRTRCCSDAPSTTCRWKYATNSG